MATSVELTTQAEAEELFAREGAVLLFKHSTRCGISAGAARQVDRFQKEHPDLPVTWARVLVVENRGLSRWLTEHLSMIHESPQLILTIDGKAVWDTSHHYIEEREITSALTERGLMSAGK